MHCTLDVYIYVCMCALRASCDPDSQMPLIANSWRAVASTNRSSCRLWHQVEGGRWAGRFRWFLPHEMNQESATLGWSINPRCWIPHTVFDCYQLVRIHIICTHCVISACLFVYRIDYYHGQHRANQLRGDPGLNVSVLWLMHSKKSFVLMWRSCGFCEGKLKS